MEVGNFLCVFLERLGLVTEKANSGKEAIDVFSRTKPDWMLLDVKMPDMDGIEVLRKIKETNKDIKVIMITGKDDEMTENEAQSLGARDYLIKPVDLDELRAKVQKYIIKGE